MAPHSGAIVCVMRAHALLLILFLIAATVPAADETGIVYGRDHAFTLDAPDGWVLDNASGKPQGLPVVFYRQGATWRTTDVVMYANTSAKQEGARTVEELVAYDVAQFRAKSARVKVTELPDIGTARVRRFEGDQYGNHEAVAYIDAGKVIVMLVLSSRTRQSFDDAYPSFEQLVHSYRFLTSNVEIQRQGSTTPR